MESTVAVLLIALFLIFGGVQEKSVTINTGDAVYEYTHTYNPMDFDRYGCTFQSGEFTVAKHGIARTHIVYQGMTPETFEWRIVNEYYDRWIRYGGQAGGDAFVAEAKKRGVTITLDGDPSWDVRPIQRVVFSDAIMYRCR